MKVTEAYEKVKKRAVTSVIRIVSSRKFKGFLFDHRPAVRRFKAELPVQAVGVPGEQQPPKTGIFGCDVRKQRFSQPLASIRFIDDHVAQVISGGVVGDDPGKAHQLLFIPQPS